MPENVAEKEKSTMIKDALILFMITLIASLLLGFVYEITKDPIAEMEAKAKNEAYQKVFPGLSGTGEDSGLNDLLTKQESLLEGKGFGKVVINEAYLAKDAAGAANGYVLTVTSKQGYGGDIKFAMGYSADGRMTGIAYLTISETPGLGMNAKEDSFTGQFADVEVRKFGLKKAGIDGDTEVDAISSATFTTKAITNGINAGLEFANAALEAGIGGIHHE